MEKVLADNNARQAQIAKENAKNNKLAILQSELATNNSLVESNTKELNIINEQISKLKAEKDKAMIDNLKLQKDIVQNKINQYKAKVTEITKQIKEMTKEREAV